MQAQKLRTQTLLTEKSESIFFLTAMFSTTTLCCKDVSFVVVVVVVVVVVLMNAFPSLLVFWVSMEVKMDFVRLLKVQVKSNTPLFHSKENVGATYVSKNLKKSTRIKKFTV